TNNTPIGNLSGSFFVLNKAILAGTNLQLAGATDNGLSRTAAATLAVGNGTQGDASGTLKAATGIFSSGLATPFASNTAVQIFNTTTTCTTGAAVGSTCTT